MAIVERDGANRELQELGSRARKDGLAARQRQAKDAARIQTLTDQAAQVQADLRLSDAARAEERRAEQAAVLRRERNYQSVIAKLQQELEAVGARTTSAAGSKAKELAEAELAQAKSSAAANANEAAICVQRVSELQAQCDRGMALVERLKLRLQQADRDKEAALRRETDLQQQLRVIKEQSRLAASQAQAAQEATLRQINHLRRERDDLREVGVGGRSGTDVQVHP